MFIFTAKLTKKKLIAAVVACGILLCGLVLLVAGGEPDDARATSGPVTQGIKSNDDRLAYLSSLGWETGAKELQAQEVRIPDDFDEVMTSYNKLQQKQGFDLLKFKGKRVMRYTYEILNHKSAKQGVYAELLVYKNRIIGGDIHNDGQDGFIQGLTGPDQCGCLEGGSACLPGCSCDMCQGKNTAAETTDGSLDTEIQFYDVGFYDEGLVYEDEAASNPDGLPPSPEPTVIEPR